MRKKDFELKYGHVMSTTDFELATETMANTWRPYQGVKRTHSGPFEYSLSVAEFPTLMIGQGHVAGGFEMDGGYLEDFFTLAIPLAGHFRFTMNGKAFDIAEGKASLYSAKQEHSIYLPQRTELCNLRIPRHALEKELEHLLHRPLSLPLVFSVSIELNSAFGHSLLSMLRLFIGEINHHGALRKKSSLAVKHIEKSFFTLLLEHQPNNYSTELKSLSAQAGEWQVFRAEEWTRSNLDKPISVGDLANSAGVSERAIRSAFRKHRQCTPMQFVRTLKLDAVHAALLESQHNSSIIDIALSYGFSHMGHFAAHYKKQFNEAPSDTLKNK
ncbi:AraC family transcriptional regulator [Agaribacterium sp. ZY112]|uniref:AraC family transcriptional regulator n=1 Tax=Agaribacterium sp. ZY112 TaxID=3233574 RepID=UPI00352383AB